MTQDGPPWRNDDEPLPPGRAAATILATTTLLAGGTLAYFRAGAWAENHLRDHLPRILEANLTLNNTTTTHQHHPIPLPGPLPTVPAWCSHLCFPIVTTATFIGLTALALTAHRWLREDPP